MKKIFLVLVAVFLLHADEEYQLGEGKQLGSLPIYMGGYFSLDYKNMGNENRYRLDDIALMAYGSYDKFSYMGEVEYKEYYVHTHKDGETTDTQDTHLYVERVYVDYNYDENYAFRVGKYNASIGFWNMLPINVLRETTSSPMSTYIIFPKYITGANLSYTTFSESEIKIDLMLQGSKDIDSEYNNYEVDEHYAFGISYEKDDFTYKLNGGYFHKIMDHTYDDELFYLLASLKYEDENYQILSELGSQKTENEFTTSYAGYIQGSYRFTEKHIGVLRGESYKDDAHNNSDDIAVFGYTYRPLYPIAFKSEYQFHSQSDLNQLLLSFSVLF